MKINLRKIKDIYQKLMVEDERQQVMLMEEVHHRVI
jgi:hypothetical protein